MSIPGEGEAVGAKGFLKEILPAQGVELAERYLAMSDEEVGKLHEGELADQKALAEALTPQYQYFHAWHGRASAEAWADGYTFAAWALKQGGETTTFDPKGSQALAVSLQERLDKIPVSYVDSTERIIGGHDSEFVLGVDKVSTKWGEDARYTKIGAYQAYEALDWQAEANHMEAAINGSGEEQ